MQGIINVYKPQDFTSHDCVAIVRRVSGIKKTGHTGTLDPMATGVLPVCVGKATRIIEYLDNDVKEYKCTMQLGLVSDTQDAWGKVTESGSWCDIQNEKIVETLKSFEGEIMQIPPKYSALKVNGRKLYEYARAGKEVEIKPRKVTIESVTDISIDKPYVSFTVCCHKGTYIRSICDDAGRILGCGAVMTALERSSNGIFDAASATDIRDIKNMSVIDIQDLLIPMEDAISFERISVSKDKAIDLINGKKIKLYDEDLDKSINKTSLKEIERSGENRMCIFSEEQFIGVCKMENDMIVADKIFNTELR